MKEIIDRKALASLYVELAQQQSKSGSQWQTGISHPVFHQTRDVLDFNALLPPVQWWSHNRSSPILVQKGPILLLQSLVQYILSEDLVHRRKVKRTWKFWKWFDPNFGIEGKEANVLLAYQIAYHIASYIAQSGSREHKAWLKDSLKGLDSGGVTGTWLRKLSAYCSL